MRVILRSIFSLTLWALLAGQSGSAQGSTSQPISSHKPHTVDRNTQVALRLAESLSSATAKKGQQVRFELQDPLVVDGKAILPEGTPVVGIVRSVKRPGPGVAKGRVVITSGSINLPSGRSLPLAIHLPDAEECDEIGPCLVVYGIMFIVESPILAIEAPLLLAGLPKLIKEEHGHRNPKDIQGVDSNLPAGSLIGSETKRPFKLHSSDAFVPAGSN